jgi:hypothetical protein
MVGTARTLCPTRGIARVQQCSRRIHVTLGVGCRRFAERAALDAGIVITVEEVFVFVFRRAPI